MLETRNLVCYLLYLYLYKVEIVRQRKKNLKNNRRAPSLFKTVGCLFIIEGGKAYLKKLNY